MLKVVFLVLLVGKGHALFIDGCPLYGCRPSGAFSYYLSAPRAEASIAWTTQFEFDPVPSDLGCCANSFNIVCQSNGPFKEDTGYITLATNNGTMMWRDKVLHFPTLPILDSVGDVTGSDGVNLVHYDERGTLFPVISLVDTAPIYSLQLVDTGFLLIVSGNGGLSVRDTNAVPVGILFLNASIEGTNGTFIPISQPVVNGYRFYILAEFVPQSNHKLLAPHLQRLYAIDVHYRLTERITVAWYFNLKPRTANSNQNNDTKYKLPDRVLETMKPSTYTNQTILEFQPTRHRQSSFKRQQQDKVSVKQNLLWDGNTKSVYVILPPPGENGNPTMGTTFWGLTDEGNNAGFVFQNELAVTHMSSFESDHCASATSTDTVSYVNFKRPIWVVVADAKVCGIQSNGNIFKTIDLAAILKTQISVTSKMSVMRSNDTDIDIAVMGIKTQQVTPSFKRLSKSFNIVDANATSFVIGIDTSCVTQDGCILWMVAVPGNMHVIGQIAGVTATSEATDDQLVMYVENSGKSAQIISIH